MLSAIELAAWNAKKAYQADPTNTTLRNEHRLASAALAESRSATRRDVFVSPDPVSAKAGLKG